MRVLPLITIDSALPLGAFTGTTGMQAIIDQMNATWNGGNNVIFSQGIFGDRYRAFTDLVTNREKAMIASVERTMRIVENPDQMFPIESRDDLENIQKSMYVPLLSYGPLRTLFEEGKISGWGVNYWDLPEDDAVGRLLQNGRFSTLNEEWMKDPDSGVKYHVRSGDPDYTQAQLEAIETSRQFIDQWLEEQLGPDGDRIDPTDLSGTIGKLKAVD